MNRRAFLILSGGLLAAPLAIEAQQAGKSPRIGWLSAGAPPDPFLEGFRDGLRKLGYVEGQTIDFEIRHARGSLEALYAGAAELAQSNVAVVVASLTAIRAARTVKNIPILFTVSGDPVEAGYVQSLARPGGNLTGITFQSLEIAGKRVELLKEASLVCARSLLYRIPTTPERSLSYMPPRRRPRGSGLISSTFLSPSLPLDQAQSSARRSRLSDARSRTRWWCFPRVRRWRTVSTLVTL